MKEHLPIDRSSMEEKDRTVLFIQDGVLYCKDPAKGPGIRMLRKATAVDYLMALSHVVIKAVEANPALIPYIKDFGIIQSAAIEAICPKIVSDDINNQEEELSQECDNSNLDNGKLLQYRPR